MDLQLRDKVAVVAASSRGLGRATAERFAREGARVVINGRREDTVRATAEDIRKKTGAEVEAVVADVAKPEDCIQLIETTLHRFGSIYTLITNAGGLPSKPFLDLTDGEWDAALNLTLMSVVRLTRGALPYLEQSGGSIVNLTSIGVKQPVQGLVLSNTIRPGVVGLGKTLAEELARQGVRINSVAPGLIWTDRARYLLEVRVGKEGISLDEGAKRVQAGIPMGRYGTAEEVANLVVFLSSAAASYITGTTILVDGGSHRGLM